MRLAEPEDAGAVLALAKAFATSFAVEDRAFHRSYAALLADPNVYFAVAEVDAEVVGYVLAFSHYTLYTNGRVAWVEELMVEGNHRRQGIGAALMRSAEEWAGQRGCTLIALATRRAAAFYEAMGYEASATYYRKLL